MRKLEQEEFICLDCETTGLDHKNDHLVEVAVVHFSFKKIFSQFETLINPGITIPESTIKIHHITNEMVQAQPLIKDVLPQVLDLVGKKTIVGHSVSLDIDFLSVESERNNVPHQLRQNPVIDTLRLARLYGESPSNSLEALRTHFHIAEEGAHRAMNDVLVNIEVFKKLTTQFSSTSQIFQKLQKPILLKTMPLGKHRGRLFSMIPENYLRWAQHQNFDMDLSFSIKKELQNRKNKSRFIQSPFAGTTLNKKDLT